MEWKREFEIGVELIDGHNRELFERFGRLLDGARGWDDAEFDGTLEFLEAHAALHLEEERRLMMASGYPLADEHARAHARFAQTVREVAEQRRASRASPWPGAKLALFLSSWLREHVLDLDQDLGRFLRTHPGRGARDETPHAALEP
ncbi:MAG TPA: hemerythrin domain-containing protein [Anaeromyxobacteraceae bacterium]|nr:hemerythrin domain-containing protein [Anaeromyxobacteraceae bacterium]